MQSSILQLLLKYGYKVNSCRIGCRCKTNLTGGESPNYTPFLFIVWLYDRK